MAPQPLALLRILCVIDHLGAGGAQRQMVLLAKGLAARGHSVDLVTYQRHSSHLAQELMHSRIDVIQLEKRSRWTPRVVFALRALLKQRRHDGAVAFLTTPSIYAEIATLLEGGPPVIVSERGAPGGGRSALVEALAFRSHRMADAVTVNSNHVRRSVKARYKWLRGKIVTIANGTDLRTFFPAAGVRDRSRALRFIAVGRVDTIKNSTLVIQAFQRLALTGQRIPSMTWVGRPDSAQDVAVQMLKRHGLSGRWEWLGEQADLASLMRDHDALIHPSLSEGLPNVVCEALACGLPVLASRVGDHQELVGEGHRGFLFSPTDPVDLARAILRLDALDDDQWMQMKRDARGYAERFLSLEHMVTRYEQLLQFLVDSAGTEGDRRGLTGLFDEPAVSV